MKKIISIEKETWEQITERAETLDVEPDDLVEQLLQTGLQELDSEDLIDSDDEDEESGDDE